MKFFHKDLPGLERATLYLEREQLRMFLCWAREPDPWHRERLERVERELRTLERPHGS